MFKNVREQSRSGEKALLTVAGPYEFQRTRPLDQPDSRFERLARAYALLDYDLGMLYSVEADRLKGLNIAFPLNWIAIHTAFVVKTLQIQDKKVGFLLMPGPDTDQSWDRVQSLAVNRGRGLEETVDLLLGISPWGKSKERTFLEKHPALFDILLGGGPGGGIKQQLPEKNGTLWVRPYRKGKTVSKMTIKHWKNTQNAFELRLNRDILVQTIPLTECFPDDPEVAEIF